MNQEELMSQLKERGALQEGHFQLSSGFHSDKYVQCMKILQYPSLTTKIAKDMAAQVSRTDFDLVISPAVGGIVLGFAVAKALDKRFIFTERKEGKMLLRRGFTINPEERVLIVDDVVTKGGSVSEVADLVMESGGRVAAISTLIDRGDKKAFDSNIPYFHLVKINADSFRPEECPLCQQNLPIYSPGSRRLK